MSIDGVSEALAVLDSIEAKGENYYPRDFRPELSWEQFDVLWKALDDARHTLADLLEAMKPVLRECARWADPRFNYGDDREVWLKLGDVRRLCAAYEALAQSAASPVDAPAGGGETQALPPPVPRVAAPAPPASAGGEDPLPKLPDGWSYVRNEAGELRVQHPPGMVFEPHATRPASPAPAASAGGGDLRGEAAAAIAWIERTAGSEWLPLAAGTGCAWDGLEISRRLAAALALAAQVNPGRKEIARIIKDTWDRLTVPVDDHGIRGLGGAWTRTALSEAIADAILAARPGAEGDAGPAFRVGHRVPQHVYEGDTPLFTAATPELAARLVGLLNAARPVPSPAKGGNGA